MVKIVYCLYMALGFAAIAIIARMEYKRLHPKKCETCRWCSKITRQPGLNTKYTCEHGMRLDLFFKPDGKEKIEKFMSETVYDAPEFCEKYELREKTS